MTRISSTRTALWGALLLGLASAGCATTTPATVPPADMTAATPAVERAPASAAQAPTRELMGYDIYVRRNNHRDYSNGYPGFPGDDRYEGVAYCGYASECDRYNKECKRYDDEKRRCDDEHRRCDDELRRYEDELQHYNNIGNPYGLRSFFGAVLNVFVSEASRYDLERRRCDDEDRRYDDEKNRYDDACGRYKWAMDYHRTCGW